MGIYTKSIVAVIVVVIIGAVGVFIYLPKEPAPKPVVEVPQPEAPKPINTVSYQCEAGKTVSAAYFAPQEGNDKGSVTLTLEGGKTMELAQVVSADGARYANGDESFVFWSKGNTVLVLENNIEATYKGCIALAPVPQDSKLIRAYASSSAGFSIRFPSFTVSTSSANSGAYRIEEDYEYGDLGPGKEIPGIRFTIPPALAEGTNLSPDSFISIEHLDASGTSSVECSATPFVPEGTATSTIVDNDVTYSLAFATDAAAGNRYEEVVYALPGTNPCLAVRYFIHYGVFENYATGTVKEFDKKALTNQFDEIRRTLVVAQ